MNKILELLRLIFEFLTQEQKKDAEADANKVIEDIHLAKRIAEDNEDKPIERVNSGLYKWLRGDRDRGDS